MRAVEIKFEVKRSLRKEKKTKQCRKLREMKRQIKELRQLIQEQELRYTEENIGGNQRTRRNELSKSSKERQTLDSVKWKT